MSGRSTSLVLASAFSLLASTALAAETIKIGTVQALSGPGASYGRDALAGLELAIEEINAAGGIKGAKVELVVRDDEGNPPKGKQLVQQLIYRDKVSAFFGNTLTTPNLASLEVTVPAGIPHLIAGTTSDVVCNMAGATEKPCPKNVVRLAILNSWQAKAIVDHVVTRLGAKKVAILHDSTEYGQDGHHMLSGPLKAAGVEVVYTGTFDFGEKNFKPHMLKIQDSGAQAILTWTLDFLVAQIAIARKDAGLTQPLLASSATTTFAYRELAKAAADGTLIADGMAPIVANPTPKQKELLEKYAAKTKRDPKAGIQYWTLTYYDAMHMLAKAIAENGTDKDKLTAALAKAQFTGPGTNVTYAFSEKERNGRDPNSIVMVEVRDGSLVPPAAPTR
jgi:branched-chain amino acid transport system substrate-binding protein